MASKTSTTKKSKTITVKPLPELAKNPLIFEILDLVSRQRAKTKKIEVLRKYDHKPLRNILIWNFDPTAISVIPEGPVPYKENEVPVGTDHTSLRREWKNLYHFVKGGNDRLSAIRRETMFIQMLEGLHPEEAEIICLVKDKALEDKYSITYDAVRQAYPDIQWGGRS